MRVKKQKRHRRAVTFYKACFGFREPFKVLCDGTFIHHLVVSNIVPADKAVSSILGGSVKLFTTSCVIAELKRLGKSYTESHQASCKLMIARCEHERVKSAESCIKEVIVQDNPEHFFVATQDVGMRNVFKQMPAVPLIYGLRNALLLEQPSAFQREFAKNSEEQRSHMTQFERELLMKTTKKDSQTAESGAVSDENDGFDLEHQNLEKHSRKTKHSANGLGVRDRPQFKRKRAKGPNPLSVKKKKKKENPNTSTKKESNAGDSQASNEMKRKRNRKRSQKGKISAQTETDV